MASTDAQEVKMDPKILDNDPGIEPGTTLSAYGTDPAETVEAPADPSVQEGLSDEAPAGDGGQEAPEPTLPPELEEMKRQLLRDYHAKTTRAAEQARQNAARSQELAQREAALRARLEAASAYDELDQLVAADPELEALIAARIPTARGKIGRGNAPNDALIQEMNQIKRLVAENQIQQVEAELAKNPDWNEVAPDVVNLLAESGLLAGVQTPAQLKAVYEMAYAKVSNGRRGPTRDAAVQRALVEKVKKAADVARRGNSAPGPLPEPEPSSFRPDGHLRSWDEIASSERGRLNRS